MHIAIIMLEALFGQFSDVLIPTYKVKLGLEKRIMLQALKSHHNNNAWSIIPIIQWCTNSYVESEIGAEKSNNASSIKITSQK